MRIPAAALLCLGSTLAACGDKTDFQPPEGFLPLFNGKDLKGWKVPDGDNGHWKVQDGVIDYDARSEAKGDKNLWTEKKYRDFILIIEWRIKETPFTNTNVKDVLPDGSNKKDKDGNEINLSLPDSDSGIFLRGSQKSQVNIWCWPVGSGEVYGYRTDAKMPAEVRAAVTPRKKMDRKIGEWNRFEITLKGDRLWVKLNGEEVIANAQLPGIPEEGPIGLQHHGSYDEKAMKYVGSPSLVQFRHIYLKELK
jgi:hypothetical protein